ncbi:DNA internalization-related competence protein ComEC/Rec2 [Lysobacter alkalisoli]|uniref:DNA internalization-related competence protein ComEC/Rec2 n=1 Tax=Marilutibacter alkalisoli TaxID=2591633 RepID=A0A514BWS0_9GAMM|nr:DNA internalization-related competence protein ComEC/Rec2 [Lysobacter alkalisoli]
MLLAGITAMLLLPRMPPWPLCAALLAVGFALLWRGRRVAAAALLGAGLAGLHVVHALSLQLPVALERSDIVVSGRIVDLPEHDPRRTRFAFRVARDGGQHDALRGRLLRLAWYDDDIEARSALRAGQHWRFTVRVRAPRGLSNPGGFDSEKYALARRIAAHGYVRDPDQAVRLRPGRGINAWRESMAERIEAAVESPSSRFVRALALGDTRGLDDDDWALLRADGLTHLVAISGLHVGLVAGFAALLGSAVWWLVPALGRRWPRPIAAAMVGLIAAAVYAAVAGFALPTVRALLMVVTVAMMRVLRRRLSLPDALVTAAMVILLADPLSPLMSGFWLSFAGVAWLVWCLPDIERSPVRGFLSAQAVATIGLLPLGVVLFGQASLAGPLANLVAVPWWTMVVTPLVLVGTLLEAVHVGAGEWLWRLATFCFDLAWPLFTWLGNGPMAVAWLPESRWFALPLAMLGAFWLLLPRGLPGRPLALLLWLPLLLPARNLPAPGEAELLVIDVGQGTSVLVRTANHSLLYDMGPAVRDGYDAGERAVVPALRALGVRQLDRAVVSHADNDHVGGLEAVVREYPVDSLWASPGSGVEAARGCVAGDAWWWDGVGFSFLHPTPYFPYSGNEASCVLRIETAHGSALLTGDIGAVVERIMLKRQPQQVRAEVVLVGHHGSADSSDPAFVEATGARLAVVSSGFGNRFRHPRPEVVERWRAAGAEVPDTARDGALRIRLGPDGPSLEARRRTQRRLWDAQARLEGSVAVP